MERRLTAADESYTHQLVAPRLVTAHVTPAWAERCFHTLFADDLMFNAGRAVYQYGGRRTAFGAAVAGGAVHAMRHVAPFTLGDDPDDGQVGPLRIEAVRPMEEIRLVLDDPAQRFAYDLTFTARFPAVPTDRNLIELNGEVVTDYMNFYQSGRYDGVVAIEGREHDVRDRLGFRDRGWGIRKHEGAPRRGFVLFATLEFPDEALYLLLYETASGRRVFTNGWLVSEAGIADTVVGIEHDLTIDPAGLVAGGALGLTFSSGADRRLTFAVRNRLFLKAGGYAADPAEVPLGHRRYDLADPATVAWLDGQNDNGCTCRLDDVEGYGVVETGIGTHVRYRPEAGGREEGAA
jgi:hypothetical protein